VSEIEREKDSPAASPSLSLLSLTLSASLTVSLSLSRKAFTESERPFEPFERERRCETSGETFDFSLSLGEGSVFTGW
jgi:hypothetical protein